MLCVYVAIGQKTSTVAEMISGLARTKDMSSVVIVLSGAHEALSQPFFVAEFFTNSPGQYVKLQATISGLTGLVDGMYDQWEEQAFYLIGDMSTLKESV